MNYKQDNQSAHSVDHFGEARAYWWNDDFLSLMAERLALNTCQSAVDIGCGAGEMTFRLAPYLSQNASVTGFDQEESHLKTARQRARHRKKSRQVDFSFVQGDAAELPFERRAV